MNKKSDYLVDVVMVTYNQEQYIAQAIESVLMQKTDFPIRLIIGEDCSTDNTRNICLNYAKKYPAQIRLILHDKNRGLLQNYKSVFDACSAKYLAILEGDDYWIDEFKLQKQVDVLEKNKEVGLVHTNCNLLYESGKINVGKIYNGEAITQNAFNDLIDKNYIRPVTVVVRKRLFDKFVCIDKYIKMNFKTLDYPFWLSIAKHTQFYYIDDITANYRIHDKSISHSNQYHKSVIFYQSTYKIRRFFLKDNQKVKNNYVVDRLTLAMHFKKYRDVMRLKKFLHIKNLKTLIIKALATNNYSVNIYHQFNTKRQNFIKN